MKEPGSDMTPQQHANAVREALQFAADRMNDARAAGVLVQFSLGQAPDGKMAVLQFEAFSTLKINN